MRVGVSVRFGLRGWKEENLDVWCGVGVGHRQSATQLDYHIHPHVTVISENRFLSSVRVFSLGLNCAIYSPSPSCIRGHSDHLIRPRLGRWGVRRGETSAC